MKNINLVFIINTWADCIFFFFKRSLAEESPSLPLWELQNESLIASIDVKHQKKYWQISGGCLPKLYNFFLYCWGQGFFKSESYAKPVAKTSTKGQQLMGKRKADYFLQDGNSCSANKWCSTRWELYWSHKLLHSQKSESSFSCFILAPGWEGIGRHRQDLHKNTTAT